MKKGGWGVDWGRMGDFKELGDIEKHACMPSVELSSFIACACS